MLYLSILFAESIRAMLIKLHNRVQEYSAMSVHIDNPPVSEFKVQKFTLSINKPRQEKIIL